MKTQLGNTVLILLTAAMMAGCATRRTATNENLPVEVVSRSEIASIPMIENMPIESDIEGSDSGTIPGLTTVYFEFDSSRLTPESRLKLKENADWINRSNGNVRIEGHCDNRGSNEYNLSLGMRRAQAVEDYLSALGVDRRKLSVMSYGEERPAVHGDTEAAFSKNRRANFVPLGPNRPLGSVEY